LALVGQSAISFAHPGSSHLPAVLHPWDFAMILLAGALLLAGGSWPNLASRYRHGLLLAGVGLYVVTGLASVSVLAFVLQLPAVIAALLTGHALIAQLKDRPQPPLWRAVALWLFAWAFFEIVGASGRLPYLVETSGAMFKRSDSFGEWLVFSSLPLGANVLLLLMTLMSLACAISLLRHRLFGVRVLVLGHLVFVLLLLIHAAAWYLAYKRLPPEILADSCSRIAAHTTAVAVLWHLYVSARTPHTAPQTESEETAHTEPLCQGGP